MIARWEETVKARVHLCTYISTLILPALIAPLPPDTHTISGTGSVESACSHVQDLGASAASGSGELHRRGVCALPESHRLLQPLHRRGVLQSARQRPG